MRLKRFAAILTILILQIPATLAAEDENESEPEKYKSSKAELFEYTHNGEGPMGITAQLMSNYFERQAQYFTFPGPVTILTADAKPWQVVRAFGEVVVPFQPSGTAVPTNYSNKGIWRAGLEMGLFGPAALKGEEPRYLVFGTSYAKPFGTNPGGLMARDVLTDKFSLFAKIEVPVTGKKEPIVGLSLASYFDVLTYALPPAAKTDWLWNFEIGVWHQLSFEPLGIVFRGDVGSAFSFSDPTAQGTGIARLGCTEDLGLDTNPPVACKRSGSFSGLKLDLSARGQIAGVRLLTAAHFFGFLSQSFSPYSTTGSKTSTILYFEASAEYRFWLPAPASR